MTNFQIADYIVRMVKSVNKDIAYAIEIVEWYSDRKENDVMIKKYIQELW